MTHQLSTAASGAGELYATSTGSGEHRQVVVVSTSGGALSIVSTSSGVVALTTASVVNLSTTSVVGLTTTATVGLTTTSLVSLSSALSNYITNSTTVPVYLGTSTSNIVGIVGLSSAVTLSSGSLTLGTLTTGTVVNLSTASVVGLTTTATVGVSTSVPVYLGASTSNVVGIVGLSSAVTLSSGTLTLGTLTTGTVIGLTTTSVVGLTTTSQVALTSGALTLGTLTTGTVVNLSTTSVVGLTTTALVGLSTTANVVSGIVANAGMPAAISSGSVAPNMVDQAGKTINWPGAPMNMTGSTFSSVTANTSMTQLVSAPGAALMRAISQLMVYSTAGTTALGKTTVMLFSSSGQGEPGVWSFQLVLGPQQLDYRIDFSPPLAQLTANNPWYIVSTSSAATIRGVAQYVTTTT